jgi:hypothetical protein
MTPYKIEVGMPFKSGSNFSKFYERFQILDVVLMKGLGLTDAMKEEKFIDALILGEKIRIMRPNTYEDVIDFALEFEEGTKACRKDTEEGTFSVNGKKNKKPNTPKKNTKRYSKEKSKK